MQKWVVGEEDNNKTLLEFLKARLGEGWTNRKIKRALDQGALLCNEKIEKFGSTRLKMRDSLVFYPPDSIDSLFPAFRFDHQSILYEDEDILAYNKPAQMTSDSKGILKHLLPYHKNLILVHRLDKGTTGIILLAKNREAALAFLSLFKEKKILKEYLAIVEGVPEKKKGTIQSSLGKIGFYQGQTIWGSVHPSKGKMAKTEWSLLKSGSGLSLLAVFPKTGRTHQIRVHLSEIQHPILGDLQYGKKSHAAFRPLRLLLHASKITFQHPRIDKKITIEAPLPEDFKNALLWMTKKKSQK